MRQEIELTRRSHDWYAGVYNYLCYEELNKFFDIPKATKTIYLIFTNKPTKDSYKIARAQEHLGDYNPIMVYTKKPEKICSVYGAAFRAAQDFGFPLYASIELD